MKKIIKITIAFVILSVIIYLILFNVPWIHKINKTIPGVQCRVGDADYNEKLTIKIEGIYLDYLVKDDRFEGKIIIDKYGYTKVAFPQKVLFINKFGNLYYSFIPKNGQLSGNFLGNLYCTPNFSQLMIGVSEKNEQGINSPDYEHPLFISAPAENRKDALEISKNLTYQDFFMGNVDWK